MCLVKLKHPNAAYIVHLIFDELPAKPKWYFLIYLSSFLSVVALGLIYFFPVIIFPTLFLGVINIALNKFYGRQAYRYFTSLSYLNLMLDVVVELSKIKSSANIPQLNYIHKKKKFARSLGKKIGWLVLDRSQMNELMEALVEYLNLFCLFDLVAFIRSLDTLKHHCQEIQVLFEAISSLDASISIASWLDELPVSTTPEFNSRNQIDFSQVYHPLLKEPAANNFRLVVHSALITGSNMAGKTTFIKTIGVNLILAQTLNICLAQKANIPALIVKSSIRREDNLDAGKSYYFVEVEELLKFIQLRGSNKKYLFLIDEIFRGTNTVERVASAVAVLEFLCRKSQVLVTTHDLELQDLLAGDFEMFHFSEQVKQDIYYFDYQIKTGPCHSRNAIKLLELNGYPESITRRAYGLAREIGKQAPKETD